jgi:hypothetical protein
VKLMAAQFVIPYRKRGKNDANDAEAICEAVGRPNMHFVAIKSEEQQSVLMVHRARTLVVANRAAQVNQIRGLLGEFGLVVPKGVARLRRELPGILGFASNDKNNLKTTKLTGEYYYQRRIGGSIGYFDITGSSDALLYPVGPVTGSANNSPDSSGFMFEVNYLPWLNTKLQLQVRRLSEVQWPKRQQYPRRL